MNVIFSSISIDVPYSLRAVPAGLSSIYFHLSIELVHTAGFSVTNMISFVFSIQLLILYAC